MGEHSIDSIRAQARRIQTSAHFSRSPTLSRLLEFVVETTLHGREHELKEYCLGAEVLGRGPSFDPRTDPIVRMQAAKLRSRLAEYYAAEGQGDPILISIPKGRYVPQFTSQTEAPAAAQGPAPERQSIAVLPFVNMSADPENEYFADGLTEELITLLSGVPGLRVVARTSVFSFKNQAVDIREIGARLNVETVLEGSVRKAGNQLRVTAQLIDVESGYHLLSRTYPRELKDVFAVQEELANAVVTEIMPQVRAEPVARMIQVRPADLNAYHLHLKGMVTLSRSFTGPLESVDVFRQALALDPEYAPAWAGLAYAYFIAAWYSILPAKEAMPLGKAAAESSIRLDPGQALGYTALAAIQAAFEWNWPAAERSFQRAAALQPSLALAPHLYAGTCCLPRRRYAEAKESIERALELNPFDIMLRAAATHVFAVAENYRQAMNCHALGVEINPQAPLLYRSIGLAHQKNGRLDLAITAFQTACEVSNRAPLSVAGLGNVLATAGQLDQARELLAEVRTAPRLNAFAMAVLQTGLGQLDEAVGWLERAVDDREPYAILMPADCRFGVLSSDSRYRRLLASMGLGDVSPAGVG